MSTSAGPACVYKGCVGGRRFAGLGSIDLPTTTLGAYFAHMAYLEAASVIAFTGLAEDLEGAGAAPWLVRRCRAAARDEARHARDVGQIARELGWTAALPSVDAIRPPQSLAQLLLENAVEGRREAYGALVASWLAHLAPPKYRRVLRAIARDEARHASLSFVIEAWLETHPAISDEVRRRAHALRVDVLGEVAKVALDDAISAFRGSADKSGLREPHCSPSSRPRESTHGLRATERRECDAERKRRALAFAERADAAHARPPRDDGVGQRGGDGERPIPRLEPSRSQARE